MDTNLHSLIERIQREGVSAAEKEASRIVSEAQSQAEASLKAAEEKGSLIVRKAEDEGEKFRQRGIESLEHASRDMLLEIVVRIEKIFTRIIEDCASESLKEAFMRELITKMIDRFVDEKADRGIEVFVNPEEAEALKQHVHASYAAELAGKATIMADEDVFRWYCRRKSLSGFYP
jgi:F0F1-type ATP synthase membrane subunit b/b'